MIELLEDKDLRGLIELHQKFYKDEFLLQDFLANCIHAFAIKDDSDKIISAICLRTLIEVNAMINKDLSPRQRRTALLQALEYIKLYTSRIGFEQFHVS